MGCASFRWTHPGLFTGRGKKRCKTLITRSIQVGGRLTRSLESGYACLTVDSSVDHLDFGHNAPSASLRAGKVSCVRDLRWNCKKRYKFRMATSKEFTVARCSPRKAGRDNTSISI